MNVERQRELKWSESSPIRASQELQLQLPLQLHLKLRPLPLPLPPPLAAEPLLGQASEPGPAPARPTRRPNGLMALTWREAKRILLLSSMVPPVDRRQGPPSADLAAPASGAELSKKRRSAEPAQRAQLGQARQELHDDQQRRQRHSSQLQVSDRSISWRQLGLLN